MQEHEHPLRHIDLTHELRVVELTGHDLHGFLAEGIDVLLEQGLSAARAMARDRLADLDIEPSWGAARSVAQIKSAMQTAQ
jgi:hypothetical protein